MATVHRYQTRPWLVMLFLAGDNWALVARNCSILAFYAFILIAASRRSLRKRLL